MRGDSRGLPKVVELLLYGLLVWYLIGGTFTWHALAFAVLWGAGGSGGWGSIIGPLLYHGGDGSRVKRWVWWQVDWLRRHMWVAAWVRGALWGAPCLLLCPWEPATLHAALAITVAFPVALLIGRYLEHRDYFLGDLLWAKDKWSAHEPIRGVLVGVCCALLSWGL